MPGNSLCGHEEPSSPPPRPGLSSEKEGTKMVDAAQRSGVSTPLLPLVSVPSAILGPLADAAELPPGKPRPGLSLHKLGEQPNFHFLRCPSAGLPSTSRAAIPAGAHGRVGTQGQLLLPPDVEAGCASWWPPPLSATSSTWSTERKERNPTCAAYAEAKDTAATDTVPPLAAAAGPSPRGTLRASTPSSPPPLAPFPHSATPVTSSKVANSARRAPRASH
jgi:hypothetical protein